MSGKGKPKRIIEAPELEPREVPRTQPVREEPKEPAKT